MVLQEIPHSLGGGKIAVKPADTAADFPGVSMKLSQDLEPVGLEPGR